MKTHPTKLSEPPVRYQLQYKARDGWHICGEFAKHKEAVEHSTAIMTYNIGSGFLYRLIDLRTNKVIDIEGQD